MFYYGPESIPLQAGCRLDLLVSAWEAVYLDRGGKVIKPVDTSPNKADSAP